MDQRGFEPRTSALPRRRATNCATSPCVGDRRIERRVFCSQGRRVAGSLAPDWCPDRRHLRADGRVHLMLSAVELTRYVPEFGVLRTGGRSRTHNLRCWRPLLYQLSYAHMELSVGTKKPPLFGFPGGGWFASACSLVAPAPGLLIRVVADSPECGRGRQPLRLVGGRPQHVNYSLIGDALLQREYGRLSGRATDNVHIDRTSFQGPVMT